MVIHTFGGYYGLTISWILYRPKLHQSKHLHGSVYHSDVFAMIGEKMFISKQNFWSMTFDTNTTIFFCSRYPLPLDVLAQFQLCHFNSWRWATSSCHQYIPGPGSYRPRHLHGIQPFCQERQIRHGNLTHLAKYILGHVSVKRTLSVMTGKLHTSLCWLGSYPECHSGWRCCIGNSSWIYDHTLWFTYCWLPLWDPLHHWLPSVQCKCCKRIHLTVLLNVNSFIIPLKCSVLHTAIHGEISKDPRHMWNP